MVPLRHKEIILGNRCCYWRRLSDSCPCALSSYSANYAVNLYSIIYAAKYSIYFIYGLNFCFQHIPTSSALFVSPNNNQKLT